MLDRHEDMLITGGRNPFLCHYRVGFNEHGKIQVLDVSVYNNGGSSRDLSAGVSTPHIYIFKQFILNILLLLLFYYFIIL